MDGCWTVRVILPDLGAQLAVGRLRVLYLLTDSLDTGGPNHYRALLPYHVAAGCPPDKPAASHRAYWRTLAALAAARPPSVAHLSQPPPLSYEEFLRCSPPAVDLYP